MANAQIPHRVGMGWESSEGPPAGVGICLSGGGLRAATFSLGVLQALQSERGLVFGKAAAEHLSAVSGGSYIAAAYVANAVELAQSEGRATSEPSPYAVGSPEEEHLLAHGRYLMTPVWRQVVLAVLGVVSGPGALVALLIWIGFFIADISVVVERGAQTLGLGEWVTGWPWWVSIPSAAAGLAMLGRSLFAETRGRAFAWFAPGAVASILFLPSATNSMYAIDSLGSLAGWVLPLLTCLAIVLVSAAIALVLRNAVPFLGVLERLSVQLLVLTVLGAAATLFMPLVLRIFDDTHTTADVIWFGVALVGPFLAALVLRRTALHQFYRNSLHAGFGAIRTSAGTAQVPAVARPYSELVADGVPRLLISATANVRHRDQNGRRRTFGSFVFSHDQSGIPSSAMIFSTPKLETARSDAYLGFGTEPLLTLPTAVAATGAAISASMGRHTRPALRLVLALMNIRLGRTLPNATRAGRREQVDHLTSPARLRTRTGFLPGIDDLIAELLGVTGPNMYVSDGGHYDNLGLMTLLRARCETIWCVDSSPDKFGASKELRRVIDLAEDELGCRISLDLDPFITTQRGVYRTTHVAGTIDYRAGQTGRITIIKLGLHSKTPPHLLDYRVQDRAFPHHSTLRQLYAPDRMRAYRDLGRDNTLRSLADMTSLG